jgi:hypothetical protein
VLQGLEQLITELCESNQILVSAKVIAGEKRELENKHKVLIKNTVNPEPEQFLWLLSLCPKTLNYLHYFKLRERRYYLL